MKSRFVKEILINKNKGAYGRILVITGSRQTGKTTLAKKCFPMYKYLSIEDPVLRQDYKKLTAEQWQSTFPFSILDEVQKEPVLIESIKSVYDQYEEPRYVLLGSSQLLLLSKVRESLAGRCSIYEVFPLTVPELLSENWETSPEFSFFQKFLMSGEIPDLLPSFSLMPDYSKKINAFDYYMKYGGYPALVDESITHEERVEWLNNYIRTYLERDVRDLAAIKNLEPFIKMQQVTALLTGNQLNYTMLAKECGVTSNTAQRFLSYLEMSYQVILIKPWHKNDLKRLTKSPKLHYLDPGIQKAIIKKQGMVSGNEFESAMVAEIYKQIQSLSLNIGIFHLRTSDGKEIDLLLELEKGYIAIEIKMSSHVNSSDARHLKGLEDILDKPLLQSFVVSNDKQIKMLGKNIHALPAALFLT